MPNKLDFGFFLVKFDMHLIFAICTILVFNFGLVKLEDSDILGSEYLHLFIFWYEIT